ncbi:NADPH:quinone reductase [Cellulomonas chitinilytica]|uniref:NADPH:quinone reductase n=1 Tax=Cellulomonas chitinilytica TaxID=398759 RepID=A0A919U0T6_9CELL|nr:NADP-dependent oxidoreductase [Cellulomonas chitinilytica]GIG23255.1 NADPH:quinone reductase [Cellulomonas chitinilytica]
MRALALGQLGGRPSLQDLPVPTAAPGEVLVRVRAASVNGFDVAVVAGWMSAYFEYLPPVVVGKDFAGVVEAVGDDVTGFAPGDRVFGVVTKTFLREGSYAEYTTVAQDVGLAHLPDGISFTDGAALGLAGSSAHDCVVAAELEPGTTVLVVGSTGGVGTHVTQLAQLAGARVIGTAHNAEQRAYLAALGVTEVVDYDADLAAQVHALAPEGVDVVVHLAGDAAGALAAARPGGRFVSLLVFSPEMLPSDTVTVVPVAAHPSPETLATIAENHATGRVRTLIDQTFSLEGALDALAAYSGSKLGKIVITVDD